MTPSPSAPATDRPHTNNRILEFDALRVVALCLILVVHSSSYIPELPVLDGLRDWLRQAGLGIFFFLSGYSIQYSSLRRSQPFQRGPFLVRRLNRIYPLYLVAFALFLLCFHVLKIHHSWNYSPLRQTIFLHGLLLQEFFAPTFPVVQTLWFVSAIAICYALFSLSGDRPLRKFLLLNTSFFVGAIVLRYSFGIIDIRLFLYYPFFIAGVVLARADNQSDAGPGRARLWGAFAGAGLVSAAVYTAARYWELPELSSNYLELPQGGISYVATSLYGATAVTVLVALAYLLSPFIARLPRAIAYLSAISYAAYLLHRPVYALVYAALEVLGASESWQLGLFPLATLLVLAIAAAAYAWEQSVLLPWFKTLQATLSRLV